MAIVAKKKGKAFAKRAALFADGVAKLSRTLEKHAPHLFAEPFLY